jgi:5'-3' exonuclease
MIIIDMNQIMISNLMSQLKHDFLNEKLVRHMVLTSLRSYEKQYSPEYGTEIVLAYDSKHYWRKDLFPFYKQNRKKDREKSGHDWSSIFEVLNKIRDEIREYFPYKVVEVFGAEADDVISTLCKNKGTEKILILSGDKDFIQLQKHPGVKQFNPVTKQFVTHDNPFRFIKEHIIRGDKSDGIPNFLSSDDTFVSGSRQKPISQKKITQWVQQNPSEFCVDTQQLRNYHRNQRLIDFDCIPQEIEDKIMDEYRSLNTIEKKIPLEYFQKHQLNDLMGEFFFRSSSPFKK